MAAERKAELGTEVLVSMDGRNDVLEGPLSAASTDDGHGEWKTVCVGGGDKHYCVEKPQGGRLWVTKSENDHGTTEPTVSGALLGVGLLIAVPVVIGTALFFAGGSTGR